MSEDHTIDEIEEELETLKGEGILDKGVNTKHIASKMSYKHIDRCLDRIHESRRQQTTAITVIFGLLVIAILIIAYINMRAYNEALKTNEVRTRQMGVREFGNAFLLFIAAWIAFWYVSER